MAAPKKRGRPMVWCGEKLERLRQAYVGPEKILIIALEFRTNDSNICRLAIKHGWPRRYGRRF